MTNNNQLTIESHFEADDVSLSRVFKRSQDTFFKVPRFQRQYTWSNDNIEDFWSDIKSNDIMFFGTLLFNTKNQNSGFIEIVDGQQRITTVTIFCSLLRNLSFELAKDSRISSAQKSALKEFARDKIEKNYLFDTEINPETSIRNDKFYLEHNKEDFRRFFRENIQELNPGDYHKILSLKFPSGTSKYNVVENYRSLKDLIENDETFIKSVNEDKAYGYIYNLIKRFDSMKCVEIEIMDESLAYEYFDAVNARGVELSVSDLLKNLFLQNLSQSYMPGAVTEWDRMEDSILSLKDKGASIDRFFNYYWCAKRQYISGGGKKLYKSIKKSTVEFDKEDWKDELLEISSYCDLYCDLLSGDIEKFRKISDHHKRKKFFNSLQALRSMKNDTWIIFLMNYFFNVRIYEGKGLYADEVGKTLEYFVFNYFTVSGLGGNNFFTLMHSSCKKFNDLIRDDSSPSQFFEEFQDFKNKIREYKPKDKEHYIDRAIDRIKYEQTNTDLIRYIFSKIEKDILGGNPGGWNIEEVDIEHIVPQSPKQHWKFAKKDLKPPKTFHLIGNLCLLERNFNMSCGNKNFAAKKAIYKNSRFKLVNENSNSDFDLVNSNKWIEFDNVGLENIDKLVHVIENRSRFIIEKFVYPHWVENFYKNL